MLKSKLCTQADFEMDWFRSACTNLREHWSYHRKVWEFCYIYHALLEREMLGPLRSGLGFGVGKEPLAAAFANHGCRILATDLDSSDTKATFWAGANQHASVLADLNERGICPPDQFTKLVQFSGMDMNKIPESCFGKFDFTWSSCSMDHLGSLEIGRASCRERV